MEVLNPTYCILLQVRFQLSCGVGVLEALRRVRATPSDFSTKFQSWLIAKSNGLEFATTQRFSISIQRIFIEVLERGLAGQPILSRLDELEIEMKMRLIEEIELHTSKMPILLTLPLVGLIFPSFMLLLAGPILNQLMESLK